MDFLFGYQLAKNINATVAELYKASKMFQFEIDEERETMIAKFGTLSIQDLIGKTRASFNLDSDIQELIMLLKEEEIIKDDEFYSRFQMNLQRKMRTSFLKKDIQVIKGAKIADLIPFYNSRGGVYGIKIETDDDREIWIRFHGVLPQRNSLLIAEKGDISKRIPSISINNVNQPKKKEGGLEMEIPENITTSFDEVVKDVIIEEKPIVRSPVLKRTPKVKETKKAKKRNDRFQRF